MLFYNEQIFKRCFHYPKRYWYKNIKYIPLYFKLMHHLIKYGYDEYATWETANWFIDTMKSILPQYKNHMGVPIILDNYDWYNYDEALQDENMKAWYSIIDRMVELLDLMDECNPKYCTKEYDDYDGYKKQHEAMNKAKNEFFELFSKYFYNLWD